MPNPLHSRLKDMLADRIGGLEFVWLDASTARRSTTEIPQTLRVVDSRHSDSLSGGAVWIELTFGYPPGHAPKMSDDQPTPFLTLRQTDVSPGAPAIYLATAANAAEVASGQDMDAIVAVLEQARTVDGLLDLLAAIAGPADDFALKRGHLMAMTGRAAALRDLYQSAPGSRAGLEGIAMRYGIPLATEPEP